MVHRLSLIRGFHLHASDGEIGHVDDFLIDEATLQIRYLMVDTSNWIGGTWVAVSPASVTSIEWAEQRLHVALTREEIKNSPTMLEANVPSHEMTPPFLIM